VRGSIISCSVAVVIAGMFSHLPAAELKTWDGKHSVNEIEVTMVYYVPQDREPLVDWKERVEYFARRIEAFHAREFGGQSKLRTKLPAEPFHAKKTTAQLRAGDGDHTFFQTLREVDETLKFAQKKKEAFPILLVLSEINWRPLDDFYRLHPNAENRLVFEGSMTGDWHVPGAAAGGARATYLSDRGKGWGLVSADGWRVPYRGSDCVVYHEGVGHSIGLPHPEPGTNSVMGFGQYQGWISESFVDESQKRRLGWKPADSAAEDTSKSKDDLFTVFRALPHPAVPQPDETVALQLRWPKEGKLKKLQVRTQTDVHGHWVEVSGMAVGERPDAIVLGKFDRPTPVSYRLNAEWSNGETAELWGYFQVRGRKDRPPQPVIDLPEFQTTGRAPLPSPQARPEMDLLELMDTKRDQVQGTWTLENHTLESPKEYGARLEIPFQPPEEYELQVIAEPLDAANGLLLGQRSGQHRFAVLVNYATDKKVLSALENIAGENVGNPSTVEGAMLKKGRPSLITCTVRKTGVTVSVDGREVIQWVGDRDSLSLSNYWKTPTENALFIGAYDCRYRITRATLTPLTGEGKKLVEK
jgi:hypothetical protein